MRLSSCLPPDPSQADPGSSHEEYSWTTVLHDANNSLAAAWLYAQVLRQDLSTSAQSNSGNLETLQVIESNVDLAVYLLSQCRRRAAPAACDVVALIHRAVAQAPPERATDVEIHCSGGIPSAGQWDAITLVRILANLVDNAAKYSAPGAPILNEAGPVELGVEVVVRDRGIGVPEGAIAGIFSGYRAANACSPAPGSGIGL